MGRLPPAGLLPALLLALLTLSACPGSSDQSGDPTLVFAPTGERVVRTMGVYSGGDRVGVINRSLQEGKWPGMVEGSTLLLTETVDLQIVYRDTRFPLRTESKVVLEMRDLTLRAARVATSFGAGQEPITVTHRRLDRDLVLRVEEMGGSRNQEAVALPAGIPILEALALILARHPEEDSFPGGIDLFSLSLRQKVGLEVAEKGREGDLREFEVRLMGIEESVWIDRDGMVVRETMPWGLSARPLGPQDEGPLRSLDLEALLEGASIPAQGVPPDIRDLESVQCLLEGIPQAPPGDRWQMVRMVKKGAELTISRPVIPPPAMQLSRGAPSREAILSLGDPSIISLSERVTKGKSLPWDKALAAGKWVYSNMGKSLRECTSASDAFKAGEGECQSHALLTAAICQSAGVPTRFLSGVVYLPERRSYFFHGWLEVDVGEWIPIDPTLGRFPAGVDHIVLARGAYLDQLQVAPFVFLDRPWRVVFPAGKPVQ